MPDQAPPVLPWNWQGRGAQEVAESWKELAEWVRWFVARYHLAGRVPACWYRHPGLVDELKGLWYHHRLVFDPPRPFAGSAALAGLMKPGGVVANDYTDWHEVRWRWTIGPLAEAAGYRECLAKNRHVEDRAHDEDAAEFGEAVTEGLRQATESGEIAP
jgi:hypothetical protein